MAKNCKFSVRYGNDVARFSNRADALRFGRLASVIGSAWTADTGTAVSASDGLIGQFIDGKATNEFAFLDRE